MGRELRRKQAKKEGKTLEKDVEIEEMTFKKFNKILIYFVIFAGFVYLITAVFKDDKKNMTNTTASSEKDTSVSNTILASESLSKSGDYYVYFYNYGEKVNSIELTLSNKLSDSTIYRVDTNNGFNSKYVSDTTNPNAKTIDELKVSSPTLIKVSNGTIVNYYEGKEVINNSFGG